MNFFLTRSCIINYGATPQLQHNSLWCWVALIKLINLPSGFLLSVHANSGSFTLSFCKVFKRTRWAIFLLINCVLFCQVLVVVAVMVCLQDPTVIYSKNTKLSILSSHWIWTKSLLAYMLDVHSLKYEAHGKFGKRDRCLRVPQYVSGNSLCNTMYTHTSLAFAPG